MKNRLSCLALIGILLVSASTAFADGWTTTPAKIKRLYAQSDSVAWIVLEQEVENINNCSYSSDTFYIDNLDLSLGKVNFSLSELAYSLKHKITIHSDTCNSTGRRNTIRSISIDIEDNL